MIDLYKQFNNFPSDKRYDKTMEEYSNIIQNKIRIRGKIRNSDDFYEGYLKCIIMEDEHILYRTIDNIDIVDIYILEENNA